MLDPFYLIVDSFGWIARLLPCGVRLVQLRIKNKPNSRTAAMTLGAPVTDTKNEGWYEPDALIRAEIAKAKELCARHGAQLVVNDYWRQAIDLGCDFIHLGQGDLDTADLAAIRRAGLRLGVSTHDGAELFRALAIAPDYIALGPIFPTILKQMAFAPQGLPRIGEWKKKIGGIPLVAIGGITLERVHAVLEAGADSAAGVTDISLNADPEQRARDWLKATRGFLPPSQ